MEGIVWIWGISWVTTVLALTIVAYRAARLARDADDARLVSERYVRWIRSAVIGLGIICSALVFYTGVRSGEATVGLGGALIISIVSGAYAAVGAPQWVAILVLGATARGAARDSAAESPDVPR